MSQAHLSACDLNACLPALRRFALTLTRDEDRAQDLVQDAVERCLRKAHLFDGRNLRAWMFTVCRRVFLSEIRREKSRGPWVDLDELAQTQLSEPPRQEEIMHFQAVAERFQQLPHNDKVVLSLIGIEGLKYEEAAELLDLPVGTVRSRLSRARSRLREMIENSEHNTTSLQRLM